MICGAGKWCLVSGGLRERVVIFARDFGSFPFPWCVDLKHRAPCGVILGGLRCRRPGGDRPWSRDTWSGGLVLLGCWAWGGSNLKGAA